MSALPMFLCKCEEMTLTRTLAKEDALSRNPKTFEESYEHFKTYMLKKIRDECNKPKIRPLPNECVFCDGKISKNDLLLWLNSHKPLVRQLLERSIVLLARENADILIAHFKKNGEISRRKK